MTNKIEVRIGSIKLHSLFSRCHLDAFFFLGFMMNYSVQLCIHDLSMQLFVVFITTRIAKSYYKQSLPR